VADRRSPATWDSGGDDSVLVPDLSRPTALVERVFARQRRSRLGVTADRLLAGLLSFVQRNHVRYAESVAKGHVLTSDVRRIGAQALTEPTLDRSLLFAWQASSWFCGDAMVCPLSGRSYAVGSSLSLVALVLVRLGCCVALIRAGESRLLCRRPGCSGASGSLLSRRRS
jgi:hypothetical protein